MNPSASAEGIRDPGSIPGSRRSPGEEMAAQSSVLTWKIPWTEESGRLPSIGSQRIRCNFATEHTPLGKEERLGSK